MDKQSFFANNYETQGTSLEGCTREEMVAYWQQRLMDAQRALERSERELEMVKKMGAHVLDHISASNF